MISMRPQFKNQNTARLPNTVKLYEQPGRVPLKKLLQAFKMNQELKLLATKPDILSSVPETHMKEK